MNIKIIKEYHELMVCIRSYSVVSDLTRNSIGFCLTSSKGLIGLYQACSPLEGRSWLDLFFDRGVL